jgi:hypothetical protein
MWGIGQLQAHSHTPSILLSLETPAEGLFYNLSDFGLRIRFNVLHGCDMFPWCPFSEQGTTKSHLERDPESTAFWWWRNVSLCEELLHNKRWVTRYVIVKWISLSLPVVAPLPANCMAQSLQNMHVEMTSNTVQAVRTYSALNRRYQRIPENFWLPLVL